MKYDITIPVEMGSTMLSVEEIGAMVLVMTFPYLTDDTRHQWMGDETFTTALASLIYEGIISIGQTSGVDIDLTWITDHSNPISTIQ